MTSVAAKHARGKKLKDVIFVTAGQAAEDTKLNGRENVVNGTLGAIYDEEGNLVLQGFHNIWNVLKKNALAILVLTALFVASQPLVVQVVFIIWYITILNLEMKY